MFCRELRGSKDREEFGGFLQQITKPFGLHQSRVC